MNNKLFAHLLESGLETEVAETIAKSFDGSEEDGVDQNELVKAMVEIRETFEKGNADHEEELQAAIEEAADVVDAVSKGADALLAEVREQNDSLAKGMIAMAEALDEIRAAVAAKEVATEEVQKSLRVVQDKVDTPVVKSVDFDADVLDHPATSGEEITTRSLISKALSKLENLEEEGGVERGHNLSKAITLLESGANPVEIAAQFDLN